MTKVILSLLATRTRASIDSDEKEGKFHRKSFYTPTQCQVVLNILWQLLHTILKCFHDNTWKDWLSTPGHQFHNRRNSRPDHKWIPLNSNTTFSNESFVLCKIRVHSKYWVLSPNMERSSGINLQLGGTYTAFGNEKYRTKSKLEAHSFHSILVLRWCRETRMFRDDLHFP